MKQKNPNNAPNQLQSKVSNPSTLDSEEILLQEEEQRSDPCFRSHVPLVRPDVTTGNNADSSSHVVPSYCTGQLLGPALGRPASVRVVDSAPVRLSFVLIVCAGDPAAALRLTTQLISLGADVSLRSRWTNMNALHYAAYFDVPELIRVLLKAAKPRGNFYTRQYCSDRSEGNRR